MNQLDALRQHTVVVADTADVSQIAQFRPRDATTNPSLAFKAAQQPLYAKEVERLVARFGVVDGEALMDRLLVRLGCDIVQQVPGRVSTEVDARLSFDTEATVARAQRLIELYQAEGVHVDRVLIKIAATWEGIRAAERLERQGIHTNLTLLFGFCQAAACGAARVQLISPFVGRIYDWAKQKAGPAWDEAAHAGVNDPGVQSLTRIYHYFKCHGLATEIMGASFRNTGQILALAGCDLLTIAPPLLAELAATAGDAPRRLSPQDACQQDLPYVRHDEASFRFALNADAMATEKLAEGIRLFVADTERMLAWLRSQA